MKLAIARSLLSIVLLPSITVACGGGLAKTAAPPPVVVTPAPPSPAAPTCDPPNTIVNGVCTAPAPPPPTPPPPTPPPPTPPPTPPPSVPPLPTNWTATDLPPITGAGSAQANALNNLGHVVGYSVDSGIAHATLWESGMAIDLGPNSFANGIKDSDEIVGYRLDDPFLAHAHLWPEDIDLGSLVGFDSSVATGINSSGLVVGTACSSADPNVQTMIMHLTHQCGSLKGP